MKLLLFHPQLIDLSCKECATKLYDLDTGKPQTYLSGPERVTKYYTGVPTPCTQGVYCPKESPDKEHLYVLSDRNKQAYRFYKRLKAGMDVVLDDLAADNVSIIDSLMKAQSSAEQAKLITALMTFGERNGR